MACDTCSVRNRSLCGVLSPGELARLNAISVRRSYRAHDLIFNDSDEPEVFGNILSGVVKLSKIMPDGRHQIVGLQFASDFLGRPFAKRHPFFAEAATQVELCCFRTRDFEQLMREIPDLEHRMFKTTLDELDAARDWMLLLGRKSAEERTASFLALIAKRYASLGCSHSNDNALAFDLPLTRGEIADYLGLTIETVSRQFTRLKARGLINTISNRTLEVPDIDALTEVAGESVDFD